MLCVFFCVFCVWLGVFCPFFAVFLFLGSLFEKIFGSEVLFLCVGVGLVFFGGVLHRFGFVFWRFAPETVWKNSLDVRSAVSGFVLSSLGFSPTSLLFFFRFKRQRSGSHRTPPHSLVLFVPFFFSRRGWFIARFGRASRFLAFSSGCHSGPCVFGILLELMGLELARPFRGPFLAARVFLCFLCLVLFSPFCFVLRLRAFSRSPRR